MELKAASFVAHQKKETKQRKYREFKEYVLEKLRDPEFALVYLNESFHEDDQEDFLTSLGEIFEARGRDIASVAQETKLSRQNLNKHAHIITCIRFRACGTAIQRCFYT
jgi:DNA-binding phage protein